MDENKKKAIINNTNKYGVEFSNEFNIGLDYNSNLRKDAKEQIKKVKDFYDSRL